MPYIAESDWTLAMGDTSSSLVQQHNTHIGMTTAQDGKFRVAANVAPEQLDYAMTASESMCAMYADSVADEHC